LAVSFFTLPFVSRLRAVLLWVDRKHRDWRFTYHPLRGAPQEGAVETGVTVRRHHDQVCFEILGSSDYGLGRLALDQERLATPVSEISIGNPLEPVFDGFFPIRDWFQGPWQTRGDHVDNAHLRPVTRGKTGDHLKSRHRLCLKLYRAENPSEELSHTRQSISRAIPMHLQI